MMLGRPALPGSSPSVQPAQQFLEIAVARLRRRGFESAAQRGGDAGMCGGDFNADETLVHHVEVRRGIILCLQFHLLCKRPNPGGSFVSSRFPAVTVAQ